MLSPQRPFVRSTCSTIGPAATAKAFPAPTRETMRGASYFWQPYRRLSQGCRHSSDSESLRPFPGHGVAAHLVILRRKYQAFACDIEMGASVKRVFDINATSQRRAHQAHVRDIPHDCVRAQNIALIGGEIRSDCIGNGRFCLFRVRPNVDTGSMESPVSNRKRTPLPSSSHADPIPCRSVDRARIRCRYRYTSA